MKVCQAAFLFCFTSLFLSGILVKKYCLSIQGDIKMLDFKLKLNKKIFIILAFIVIIFLATYFFISRNQGFYHKTIAKIISVDEKSYNLKGETGEIEQIKDQKIKAVVMNGSRKGKEIELENKTSFSQINDLNLKVNDEVFVTLNEDINKNIVSAQIIDFKRDKYMGYITILFVFLILLIGGYKGFRSLCSVIINIFIFLVLVKMFIYGFNITIVSILASILFIILSIIIVCGVNKKSFSAIVSTIVCTLIAMIISILVIKSNNWNGIHFEEMEFLTHPPDNIFLMEILIGTLGAIMDISITIASYVKERYIIMPDIETKELIKSGFEIGKDIMGTMTNTLLFAYISGSIPIILLLLRNNYPISYIINMNMSLEFIRAITGSIGVVLSIPISIYISVFLIKNNKIGEI